jgi:hypothetical protein
VPDGSRSLRAEVEAEFEEAQHGPGVGEPIEPPTRELRWFRVELNSHGLVISCEPVEEAQRSSGSVVYLRALSRDRAIEKAAKAHIAHGQKELRAQRKRDAVCIQCGRALDPESTSLCPVHLEHQRVRTENYRARKRGVEVPASVRAPLRSEQERRDLSLAVLVQVRNAWRHKSEAQFGKWLNEMIGRNLNEKEERLAG